MGAGVSEGVASSPAAVDHLPAQQIGVRAAHLTLLWPLAIEVDGPAKDRSVADAVAACATRLAMRENGVWTREPDLSRHIAQQPNDVKWAYEVYAERVYFHDFAQGFLFARQTEDIARQPLWLFRRSDVKRLEVVWGAEGAPKQASFDVKRLNLYLFRTGAAILVLELCLQDAGETLADVEDLHDILRRAYHPYGFFGENGKAGLSHLVPRRVTWIWTDATKPAAKFCTGDDLDEIPRNVEETDAEGRHRTPIFAHWRRLLVEDLPLQRYEDKCEDRRPEEGVWRQVMDERMPTMLTLSVTAEDKTPQRWLHAIRRGDFARLCFADGSNAKAAATQPHDDYPYDPTFLSDFEARHAYDRFAKFGTRFFICGYAFVAVGAGEAIDSYIHLHMRRHYFQMNLIVNLEKATLLSFSSQVSEAARRYDNSSDVETFREEMRAINQSFLQFVHRFRFTGVTNQTQGVELFDMLRREADVNRLYDDVRAEIESANGYLFNRAQVEAARESSRAADAANRLGHVAAAGVVAAMVAGLLGMNFLSQPELFGFLPAPFAADAKPTLVGHILVVLAGAGGIVMLGAAAVRRIGRIDRARREDEPMHRLLGEMNALGQGLFIAAIACLIAFAALSASAGK